MIGQQIRGWAVAVVLAALSGCNGLDEDAEFEPKHLGSYLLVTSGGNQRLELVTDTSGPNPARYSQALLGLSRVADVSAEGITLAVLSDSSRELLLLDAGTWPPQRIALGSLAAAPTRVLLGQDYALVLTASRTAYWVRRSDARLLDQALELPWVPREGVYSRGRFYVADTSRAVAIEEEALSIRASIRLDARFDTLDVPYVDGLGAVTFTGRRAGQFITASIDNLALTAFGSTSSTDLIQALSSPFIRRQFTRDYTQTVTVSTMGAPSPFSGLVSLDGGTVGAVAVARVAIDFRGSAAYFTTAGPISPIYYRSVVAGSAMARTVVSAPVQRLHKAVHLWRLP